MTSHTAKPSPTTLETLIKSKRRVKAHGEVFTPIHVVDQMLDLVAPDLETGPGFVDKTFFEPAAGDGNFLVRILQRKLEAIERRYHPDMWPIESLFAVASIYGIELLEDNHHEAQGWLLDVFCGFHENNGVKCDRRTNLRRSAEHLIASNIIQGNTLTGLTATGEPIIFSWWNRVLNVPATVQREEFSLASLRSADTLDFATYNSYEPCLIMHVHKEVKVDG